MKKPPLIKKQRLVHYAETYGGDFGVKMSRGLIRYGYQNNVAVINADAKNKTAEEVYGFGGNIPFVASLQEAMTYKPEALVMASGNSGGEIPEGAENVVKEAIQAGLDVYLSYHTFLSDDPEIKSLAQKHACNVIDLRKPPNDMHVLKGEILNAKSYICTTVGTSFSIGKMSTTLELRKSLKAKNVVAEFVATGQSGIMIEGWGTVIDAVPCDFATAEVTKLIQIVDGSDVILVEGQGSILNFDFSPVSIGILHGSCPDGLILCHRISEGADLKLMHKLIRHMMITHLNLLPFKPHRKFLGVSLNSSNISKEEYQTIRESLEAKFQVPVLDPFIEGTDRFADSLLKHKTKIGK